MSSSNPNSYVLERDRRATGLLARLISLGQRWAVRAIMAGIFLAFLVLATLTYEAVDQDLTDVALLRRASVASLAAATLSEKFARLQDIGVSLATRVRFRQLVAEGQWIEAMAILRDVPRDLPVITRVFLASTEGALMADFPELEGARGQSFSHRDWYKGVSRDWHPFVSPVYTRTAPPRINVFSVAVPITRVGDGEITGILVLQVPLDGSLFAWTKEIGVGAEGEAFIVDQKGQVAFHSTEPVREIVDVSATPVVRLLRQGKEGVQVAIDPARNEEAIFAYASVEPYGWGVITQQPAHASQGFQARDHTLRRLLLAYGLLIFLSASMVYMAHRLVVQRRRSGEERRVSADLELRVAERTAQLEAANKDQEAFSYSVSHDLRAPLRSMDGFSLVLLEDHADKLDAEGKDALNRIRGASQRMGFIIDDLLRLSQVTRAKLHVARTDLSEVAREITEALDREHPDRRVQWTIEPGLSLRADLPLMRIAMQNLLENARKFTGKLERPEIRVGAMERDGHKVYFVADNGVGFDMAHAQRLFGAFQRLHHVADFPGTGIGLTIVQRIIRRHDGQLWAEATLGKGATFFFSVKESDDGSDAQDHPAG